MKHQCSKTGWALQDRILYSHLKSSKFIIFISIINDNCKVIICEVNNHGELNSHFSVLPLQELGVFIFLDDLQVPEIKLFQKATVSVTLVLL